MLRPTHLPEKRILAIWDFHAAPYSVGDVLILNEMTLVLRLIHKVDKVDICLVCDRSDLQPALINSSSPDNNCYHYSLSTVLPVASVNPHLGSVHVFDSRQRLEAFLVDNADRYYIWPPFKEYLHRFLSYQSNFDFIHGFYKANGFIPYLSCEEPLIRWARRFIKENIHPRVPVVVHLRNKPGHAPERNARLDCWLEFFKFCDGRYDVKFVIIGGWEEIDNRFRALGNVLFSKDFGTNVTQDLALIQKSLLFLGVSSGPSDMAIFSDVPYLVFNLVPHSEASIPYGSKPAFATSLQKFIWEPETTEMLIREFSGLYDKIDVSNWKKKFEAAGDSREQPK